VLLISDLHLEARRPDITDALLNFLRHKAPAASQLYILGDLFEAWIGDDAPDPMADRVATALRELADSGTNIHLMHGNRDFLLGDDFAERCGARLIEEPWLLEIAGKRLALLHGDILCTRDTAYQEFRRLVRDPAWQQEFLDKPLSERQEFARQARQQSRQATTTSAAEIMDVTGSAVASLFEDLDADVVIHGHTHRPAIHDLPGDDGKAVRRRRRRVVLGDWDKSGWYGEISDSGNVTLTEFPLAVHWQEKSGQKKSGQAKPST